MLAVEGAVPGYEPTVRFTDFGDSSVNFNVGLRASDVSAQGLIIHEFIKRLHSRYAKESIETSSPTATIVYASPREEVPLSLLCQLR
jgi:small-conductance mechanosensitive channel